jgi:hypothetical protein
LSSCLSSRYEKLHHHWRNWMACRSHHSQVQLRPSKNTISSQMCLSLFLVTSPTTGLCLLICIASSSEKTIWYRPSRQPGVLSVWRRCFVRLSRQSNLQTRSQCVVLFLESETESGMLSWAVGWAEGGQSFCD